MDHPHYVYRARRPDPTKAPASGHGSLVQGYVVLVLEHWEALPPSDGLRDARFVGEFGSFSPDYRSWTQREYGLRIGVFRVLDALAEAGITPAVALHSRVVERLPALVRQLDALGVEWVGHGETCQTMMHSRMPLAAQRSQITAALQSLTRATGRQPTGWLSQDWGTTPDTFALLAEAGLRYTLDWTNDDAPYPLRTTPALTALPLSAEWDDVQAQWLRQMSPRAHAELTLAALGRLRDEAAAGHRDTVFGLALHPWLCGMSSRIGVLRRLLRDLTSMDGVAWTSPSRIVEAFAATHDSTPSASAKAPFFRAAP